MKKVKYLRVSLIILLSSVFCLLSSLSPARGAGVDVGEKIEIDEEELKAQVIAILQGYLNHPDEEVKLWVIKAMTGIEDIEETELEIIFALLPGLRDKNPIIRGAIKAALDNIIELEEEELRRSLINEIQRYLRDPDKDVQLVAIKILGNITELDEEGMEVIPMLLRGLKQEENPEIKEAYKKALDNVIIKKTGGG